MISDVHKYVYVRMFITEIPLMQPQIENKKQVLKCLSALGIHVWWNPVQALNTWF